MPSTVRLSHVALVALALLWPAAGCTQLDVVQPTAWFSGGDDEPQTPAKVVAVALANKIARIAWVLLARGGTYRVPPITAAS